MKKLDLEKLDLPIPYDGKFKEGDEIKYHKISEVNGEVKTLTPRLYLLALIDTMPIQRNLTREKVKKINKIVEALDSTSEVELEDSDFDYLMSVFNEAQINSRSIFTHVVDVLDSAK